MTVLSHLSSVVGAAATTPSSAGIPRVCPPTIEGCALILAQASREGWRVRLEGAGQFSAADAPADLVLSTQGLNAAPDIAPTDLVATAQAGVGWGALEQALARHNLWVPIDPPGARTTGSVVATATAGPLRAGFGGVRDQLLGLTLITGDGRVVKVGGRVAKNVAGYDLTRLACGSFGAFGLIAAVHWRLRVRPQADVTLAVKGNRDDLLSVGRGALTIVPTPAALELMGPRTGVDWTLAIRLIGTSASVAADRRAVAVAFPQEDSSQLWQSRSALGSAPVTLRVGTSPTRITTACDLITQHLGSGVVSASVAAGGVRWSGSAEAGPINQLRAALARMEMPLTLERAPWSVAAAAGHFGAYRDGVGPLVSGLRRAFDPAGVLVTPVDA